MSWTDAAEKVLQAHGDGRPMHYRDIAEEIRRKQLVHTEANKPENTLYMSLWLEIDRKRKRGERSRFVASRGGFFALTVWQEDEFARSIERRNAEVRRDVLDRVRQLTADEFEVLVGDLLTKLGFEDVEVTQHRNDGGVDARGTLVVGDAIRVKVEVEAKKWGVRNPVGRKVVAELRGSMRDAQGLIVTTSRFTAKAKTEALQDRGRPIALIDGDHLVGLLIEHQIRIGDVTPMKRPLDVLELSPTDAELGDEPNSPAGVAS